MSVELLVMGSLLSDRRQGEDERGTATHDHLAAGERRMKMLHGRRSYPHGLAKQYGRPYLLSMGRSSLREQIIDAGVTLLHERGYSACGVREITQAAGVPLGSFTNHFRSKEAFAVTVLDRYMDVLLSLAARTLRDEMEDPLARLAGYFEAVEEIAAPLCWRFGCMLANLGLELPAHSDLVRQRLLVGLEDLTLPFAEALGAGQARGQVRSDLTSGELAIIVLATWHGVLLRAKIERSGTAPRMMAKALPLLLRPSTSEAHALC